MQVHCSGVARVTKLVGHSLGIDCFNRILDCSIRVYRSFGHCDDGATEADSGASAPPSPTVDAPLVHCVQ